MAFPIHDCLARGEMENRVEGIAVALNGLPHGHGCDGALLTVADFNPALDHRRQSQAGLAAVASKNLLPEAMLAEARRELFKIRDGILKLMDEFRGRK